MNYPLVSVLMTAYNREKYIGEAIESVLASTYTNFELIVVDDGSKDQTVKIIQSYVIQDERIKLYVNDTNLGDYLNRNKAASYAKGKYLKYVDADDQIYPYGLEQLVFYMEQFPEAGYGLCSLEQDKKQMYPLFLGPKAAYSRHYLEGKSIFHKAPLSSIIKLDAFHKVGGFSGKQHLGDFELWHILSQKFSVVLMPHGIAWYREHNDQQMSDNRNDPYVPFKYLLLGRELVMHPNCPLNHIQKNALVNYYDKKISAAILSASKHYGLKKGMQLKSTSNLSFYKILKLKFR